MKKAKRQTKLQKLIQQYTPELQEAQKRVKELKGKDTLAIRRAQRSKPKSRSLYGRIFTFSDVKNQRELNREIARIRTFLADDSSQPKKFSQQRRKPFWSSYNSNPSSTGEKYDKEVYEAYRRIQENFGGEERFKAILDDYSSKHGKYDSDGVLQDLNYDYNHGMDIAALMAKYEDIITEMENEYKGLKSNEDEGKL